jgi:hypothetical protein
MGVGGGGRRRREGEEMWRERKGRWKGDET